MNYLSILSIIFYAVSLSSCIAGQKLILINNNVISVGLMVFPITYFIGAMITELYGFKQTKIIIITSATCNIIISLYFYLTITLEPFYLWPLQNHYEIFLTKTCWILITSSVAYTSSEYINATILSKLNIITKGQFLLLRAIASISIAIIIDAFLMLPVIIINSSATISNVIFSLIFYKLIYILTAMPLFVLLTNAIKIKDNADATRNNTHLSSVNYV